MQGIAAPERDTKVITMVTYAKDDTAMSPETYSWKPDEI
jgi:hypothetical protein